MLTTLTTPFFQSSNSKLRKIATEQTAKVGVPDTQVKNGKIVMGQSINSGEVYKLTPSHYLKQTGKPDTYELLVYSKSHPTLGKYVKKDSIIIDRQDTANLIPRK